MYTYANGNPISYTDPTGTWAFEAVASFFESINFSSMFSSGGFFSGLVSNVSIGAATVVGGVVGAVYPSSLESDETPYYQAEANNGDAKPHGGDTHNGAIDALIDDLKQDPSVENIRKNQQQVDVNGDKVGNNRPDVQYDQDGCHYCVEFDNNPSNSDKHGNVIRGNDSNVEIILKLLN
ncbi:hypothetical protein [Methylomonas sp. CM2]|uniref:hypothetical protein n=1 Tax=Methylomonas sp. CM2 TaxID=3417647 RepID=UPI003CEAD8FE